MPNKSCATHDTSFRSTAFSVLRELLDNTCGIAQSHQRYRGLRSPVRRRQYLCDNRIKSLGIRCFPHPPCQDPDPCGDANPCEDSDSYGIPLFSLTVLGPEYYIYYVPVEQDKTIVVLSIPNRPEMERCNSGVQPPSCFARVARLLFRCTLGAFHITPGSPTPIDCDDARLR